MWPPIYSGFEPPKFSTGLKIGKSPSMHVASLQKSLSQREALRVGTPHFGTTSIFTCRKATGRRGREDTGQWGKHLTTAKPPAAHSRFPAPSTEPLWTGVLNATWSVVSCYGNPILRLLSTSCVLLSVDKEAPEIELGPSLACMTSGFYLLHHLDGSQT